MNLAELHWMADRLQTWVGRPFMGAWQPARDRVLLGIGDDTLLLVPRGPFARVHPVASRPKNPPRPFSFQGALRARLAGPLTAVQADPDDRVIRLVFGERTLHLRLTGRSGGLWLEDAGTLVAAFDGPAPAELPALRAPQDPPAERRPARGIRFDTKDEFGPDRYFAKAEAERRGADRRQAVRAALTRQIDRTRRLMDGLRADLDHAAEAPKLRRQADALAANLHRFKRGATIAAVSDLEDPSITWELPLDPDRQPSASLEKLYAKAGRLDRAGDKVIENLDRAEARIAELTAQLDRVDQATDDALTAIEKQLPKPTRRPDDPARKPWIEFTSPRGDRVLVGRNADGNRRLTFNVAKGDDVWMHVRGTPGAHVIVVVPKGKSAPLEVLLAAAQFALAASGIDEGTAADVQYTKIRNVRAVPGKVGLVTVHDEKVLHVTRDRASIAAWTSD